MLKSDRVAWALVCGCGLLLLGAVGCSPVDSADPSAANPATAAVAVKTVTVAEQTLQRTTTQPATVHPFYRAEVRARATGYVSEVKADIGDFVEAGATLAMIDVPEMLQQREVAQARIARLESEEARAEAGIDLAAAEIKAVEAKLAQAKSETQQVEASLAAAEAEFARTEDLVQRQSLQTRVLDEVRKRRDAELASREAARSAVTSAEAEVAVAKAKQRAAEADLRAAQADTDVTRRQLDELNVMVDYATVKAPFSGVVTRRAVDPGDLVREASEVGDRQPLFVISRIDTVRVQMPVPEVDAAWVARGDAVELSFPSFADEDPLEATVTRLTGDLDPQTRTMLVEAEVDNTDMKLLPGMFGQATISLASSVTASVLPARAIRFEESGQAYVYIVNEDETVTVTPVTTGLDNGHTIQVLAGVQPGQRVIDANLHRLRDGQKVRLVGSE